MVGQRKISCCKVETLGDWNLFFYVRPIPPALVQEKSEEIGQDPKGTKRNHEEPGEVAMSGLACGICSRIFFLVFSFSRKSGWHIVHINLGT